MVGAEDTLLDFTVTFLPLGSQLALSWVVFEVACYFNTLESREEAMRSMFLKPETQRAKFIVRHALSSPRYFFKVSIAQFLNNVQEYELRGRANEVLLFEKRNTSQRPQFWKIQETCLSPER